MKRSIQVLIALLLLYIFVPILIAQFQDKLIFLGANRDFSQVAARNHEIFLETKSATLQGWFIDKPITDSRPLIIYYGGLTEDVAFVPLYFPALLDNAILSFNYRGYGLSEGLPSEQARLEDATYVIEQFLNSKNINKKDVVVIGKSIGGGVASYIARTQPIKGAIFIAPFDSLPSTVQSHMPIYPTLFFEMLINHHFDNIENGTESKVPALFLIAEHDWIAFRSNTDRFYEAYAGEKTKSLLDAGHASILGKEQLYSDIKIFIESLERTN